MSFFKEIKKLDLFWKKLITVIVLIAVGIPLGFLVGKNLQKRLKELNKKNFLKEIKFPQIEKKVEDTSLKEVKERMEEIKELMRNIEQMAEETNSTGSTTSVDSEENQ